MIIGKCRKKPNFILNDSVIENVTFYKYLGAFFHKNGKSSNSDMKNEKYLLWF